MLVYRFGPTTRRKWNDYVNQLEKNKKEKKKGGDGGARASSEARAAIAQQQAQLNAGTEGFCMGFSA